MNIRYPNITGKNSTEQLEQIRSYLYQLVQQLNVEYGTQAESAINQATLKDPTLGGLTGGAESTAGTQMSFSKIKSLIIKSADIINAYYEEINKKLVGTYVAESEFGKYKEDTSSELSLTSEKANAAYLKLSEISGQYNQIISTQANIRSGLLFEVGVQNLETELGQSLPDGTPVYGVEVGQTTTVDGKEVFNKFARFTAYGMTLYDNNGNLAAYITDRRLNVPNAVVKNSLIRGGFVETINADGSSVERWVGV